MPLDYTHEHTSRQIMREDEPHTPIDPNASGGFANPATVPLDMNGKVVEGPQAITGLGEAGIGLFVQDTDPADGPLSEAVVAGSIWIDTSVGAPYAQKSRNAGNDDWQPAILIAYNESEPTTYGQSDVNSTGGSINAYVEGQVAASVNVSPTEALLVIYDGFDIAQGVAVEPTLTTLFGALAVSGLPTADPEVAGAVWSDAGTLKVSAG